MTLEFPVQGTAAKTPGVSASKDFTFTAPNSNIQTGISANREIRTKKNGIFLDRETLLTRKYYPSTLF